MAKRKLSAEHKKKISESMKKRHASKSTDVVQKGVADAQFGAQSADYQMTAEGFRAISKSLGPDQAYKLSIDVRSAIQAIATNIGKMKIRLYNSRSGQEIVGGDIWEFFHRPAPRYTSSRWLAELASYYSLTNEVALLRNPGKTQPRFLMPLNPTKLWVHDPTIVRDISQITQWRYHWEDGLQAYYTNDQICFDKLFNPVSSVRGSSPILTGHNEIGSSYEAARYNKQYFENGAVPSHMLVLPEGTPRQQRQDIENRYMATFGVGNGNAHKVMVVSGGDIKLQELENRPKDAQFVNLMNLNTQRVAQLFKVPAIEMGIYDKTRYETASVEREMFYEGTLVPLAERIGDFLQDQIVDRWFSNSSIQTQNRNLSKTQKESLAKAHARSLSNIVVIVDHETAPIAAKVMRDKVQATAELRRSAGLSFNEAANYFDLDLPEPKQNPDNFRDMVFIQGGETRIDNLLAAPVEDNSTNEVQEDKKIATKDMKVDKELSTKVNKWLKKYRKELILAADNKQMHKLSAIDKLIEEELGNNYQEALKKVTRKDYLDLKQYIVAGDIDAVKNYMNKKDRKWIKNITIKLQKEDNNE